MSIEIIIRNKLYNITDFLDEHPGGRDIIEQFNGKDATYEYEDIGHSNDADELLKQFYIKDIKKEGEIENIKPEIVKENVSRISCIRLIYNYLRNLF